MQITRLRLVGFKSFVEPTELLIERGLTGVVGPNGCGKSNLLEALRWVMGETSHKSMRAAAMDDVIFSGTNTRPARNAAEVTLFLDNKARLAPVEFNDRDTIEITRRIEREAGSAYRINGVEARARDVKILFEDAATGARSPALVRQGQIGEIVNAKPENRRRILEDAAGVAGLHSRRHEAELRLKAADANLARLSDVMGNLSAQVEALKRQARAAKRYKEVSAEIRRSEALFYHVSWLETHTLVEREEAALREVLHLLAAATQAEARHLRQEVEFAEALEPLRQEEAVRAAILARLKNAQDNFEAEASRTAARQRDLKARADELSHDIAREEDLLAESETTTARLAKEADVLGQSEDAHNTAEDEARDRLAVAEQVLKLAEAELTMQTNRLAESRAQKRSLETSRAEKTSAVEKLERHLLALSQQIRETTARAPDSLKLADVMAQGQTLSAKLTLLESESTATEAALGVAQAAAKSARDTAAKARLDASAIRTERETLQKVLVAPATSALPPIADQLTVASGFETALGAALGDDLEASLDHAASVHWRHLEGTLGAQGLPASVEPLLRHVAGPPALTRALGQVGIVTREEGHRLQSALKPGQRLVTHEGDLWRWDGFVAAADGATPAALRLEHRNRLAGLEKRQSKAEAVAATTAAAEVAVVKALAELEATERTLRVHSRETQAKLSAVRDALTGLERAARETDGKLAGLNEAKARAEDDLIDANTARDDVAMALDLLEDADDGDVTANQSAAQASAMRARASVTEARASATNLIRDRQTRRERLVIVRSERERWTARLAGAVAKLVELRTRAPAIRAELAELADLPTLIAEQRQKLLTELADVEHQRTHAADQFTSAETALKAAVVALKTAQREVGEHREARARLEAKLEAARAKRAEDVRKAREALDMDPDACLAVADVKPGEPLPSPTDLDRALVRLRADRERLGGVNLQADDELEAITSQVGTLAAEVADVEQAIAKLRGAIGQLNREAKKRLYDAFNTVNGHFQRLFATLFGGGEARLELIETDDPLEGGLEIIAKPPGKKPATLSLLSGGEQTLTALSLIFAVFLTNPSPICVLDEVDAPLDDANVDRFCTLMEAMAAETDTRFLVITHHPMTMARTNRLFGVTMAERGISQLVSVDLETAVRFQEAG
jgi:chromosome segregation protein